AQSATFGRDEVAVTAEIPLPEAAARVLGIEVRLEGVTPARDNDQVLAERGIYWVHPETGVVDDEGYHEAFMELALDGIPDTTSSFTLTLGQIEALADGTPVTPDGLKLPEDAEISVQEDGTTWVPGYFGPYGRSDFTLRFLADEAAAAPVPAFVSQELAAALDLSEGSSLGLALDGPTVNTRVAGVVEAVPGSTDAMAVLVDLPSLTAHLVATRTAVNGPNEIWLSTDGDLEEVGAAALTLAEEQGLEGVTAALARPASTDATAPIRATFWLAAAGALALALVGAGAAAVGQGHGRDGELAVLRALGRSARRTAGARVGELLAIALPSLVLGVLLGWAVSALFIPFLSRTATAGNVPAQLTLHVPGLLAALAALLVGLVAIATMVALAVRQRMSRVGVES
nr:ABC transporter permease [Actinomycetales bacterium]